MSIEGSSEGYKGEVRQVVLSLFGNPSNNKASG